MPTEPMPNQPVLMCFKCRKVLPVVLWIHNFEVHKMICLCHDCAKGLQLEDVASQLNTRSYIDEVLTQSAIKLKNKRLREKRKGDRGLNA